MCVHYYPDVNVESIAENDVSCLAAHTSQLRQFFHRARHLAAVSGNEGLTARLDALGLVTEKTGALDFLLEFGNWRGSVICRRRVFLEQLLRDDVDPFVRTLRGEDCRDEEFEGIGEVQLAVGV